MIKIAASRVTGITVEIGGDTTGLNKALSGVNKEIGNTQKELKDVEKLLKMDPKNTELLAQKERLLAEAVSEVKTKLDTLKEAEKQVQAQFERGEISQRQYDAVKREVIATEQTLKNLTSQAEKSVTALEKVGSAAKSIGSGAKDIQQTFQPATKAVLTLEAAVVANVVATRDLRSDLSKLEQSAKDNAVSVDAAKEAWRTFAVQSGETDSAIEATANLLQAGFTESNLQKAVEGLAGAAQKFPDTLKVESLADSLQETLATGSATGQFAELLDRLGIGAENFTAQLERTTNEAQRQDLVLQTLAKAGLNDAYNAWEKNNEEMLANEEANLRLQESLAELAETVLPLVTMVTEKVSDLIGWFNDLDPAIQMTIVVVLALVAAISPVAGIIAGISTAIAFLAANPIVALIVGITALAAAVAMNADEIIGVLDDLDEWLEGVFAQDWTEIFGPVIGNSLNGWFKNIENIWKAIKKIFTGIIDFIAGVFTLDWERAWKGVSEIIEGVFSGLGAIIKAPLNGIISLINGVIGGLNQMIDGLNSISIEIPEWVPKLGGETFGINIPEIPEIPLLAKGGILTSGSAIVGEAGPELLTVSGGKAVVQPLTGGSSAGLNITMNNTFNGYNRAAGEAAARDLVLTINRALGRAY